MDKYEFKHLLEDIQSLTDQGKYADAVALADKIDWRRVKNIMTLGKISNLYKINRRYEDARDILLLAYERKPQNRQICYALCEMYCKTGEPVEAAEFYKEYEKLAPKDAGRYILKYKVYDAFDASIDEKIEVLEKLKEAEYQEKWMYELAKLYDRRGLATKCVEVCDELVLWFGVGKYVNMALELKMLHASLTPEQQRIYDNRFQSEEQALYQGNGEQSSYQNNGEELQETYSADAEAEHSSYEGNNLDGQFSAVREDLNYYQAGEQEVESSKKAPEGNETENAGMTRTFNVEEVRRQMKEQAEHYQAEAAPADDMDIQIKTVDVGTFNTMNLQAEIAKGMQEVMQDEEQHQYSDEYAYDEAKEANAHLEEDAINDVYAEQTDEDAINDDNTQQGEDAINDAYTQQGEPEEDSAQRSEQYVQEAVQLTFEDVINRQVMEDMRKASMDSLEKEALAAQPPEPMAKVLTQESDGQIRLLVPERKRLEKQITGQMSIDDIRAEWEKMKLESKAKQEEEFRQQVLRNTGQMFTKYETEMRDAILKKMEESNEFLVNAPNMPLPENYEDMPEEYNEQNDNDRDDFDMDTLGDADGADQDTAFEKEAEEQFAVGEETVEESSVREETVEESFAVENDVEEDAAWEDTVKEDGADDPVKEDVAEKAAAEGDSAKDTAEESVISEDFVEQELVVTDDRIGQNTAEDQAEENDLHEKTVDAEKLAERARLILEEEKNKTHTDFSWDQEDGWGDETDLEFASEADKPVSETTDGFADLENADSDQMHSDAEDAEIDFESLPQGEEFSYSTDGVDEAEQESFHVDFEEPEDEEPEEANQESDSEEELEEQESNHTQIREMSKEEESIYGSIVQGKAAKEQLVQLVDSISMAPYTGNVVITGEADMNTLELAKKIICEVKTSDSNFVGTVAKISGKALSGRNMQELLDGLKNGALIIEKPSQMPDKSAKDLYRMLQRDDWGIIVFLLDSKKGINGFFGKHEELKPMFNAHMHLKPLSEEALAHYARQYAFANEYSIDSMGLLALHTRIDEIQTAKHAATYEDVIGIMDDAIYSASRLSIGHFFDILLGKRYDEEDMIIITEKDFR